MNKKIIIVIILISGLIFVNKYWRFIGFSEEKKIVCENPYYKPVGTKVEKSYKTIYRSIDDWRTYNDSEVKFFFTLTVQDLFSSKIYEHIKGYDGLSYTNKVEKSLSIDKGYYNSGCQPLRYYYYMNIVGTIPEKYPDKYLSDITKGMRSRREDIYHISATYKPEFREWDRFDIKLLRGRLVPEIVINETFENAYKSIQFRQIKDGGYEIIDIYWTPRNENKNDTVSLVYRKVNEYYSIEVDNFQDEVVSEKKWMVPSKVQ